VAVSGNELRLAAFAGNPPDRPNGESNKATAATTTARIGKLLQQRQMAHLNFGSTWSTT
jgi:hypothetical protein